MGTRAHRVQELSKLELSSGQRKLYWKSVSGTETPVLHLSVVIMVRARFLAVLVLMKDKRLRLQRRCLEGREQ